MGSNSLPVSVSVNTNPPHNNNHTVFVYGSLLADEVVRVLLRRIPQSFPAVLDGFHRFSIKGRVYPAILPVENMKVTGKVLLGITPPELDILDAFEDVEYERRAVNVSLLDNHENLQAHAYVWANNADENLYGEWHFEEWKKTSMEDFVKMTSGFVDELELPEATPRIAAYESFYLGKDDKSLP